jgi:hypothetical protein
MCAVLESLDAQRYMEVIRGWVVQDIDIGLFQEFLITSIRSGYAAFLGKNFGRFKIA